MRKNTTATITLNRVPGREGVEAARPTCMPETKVSKSAEFWTSLNAATRRSGDEYGNWVVRSANQTNDPARIEEASMRP